MVWSTMHSYEDNAPLNYLSSMEESKKISEKIMQLEKIIETLRNSWILVEGKRDKATFQALGCKKVLTISGNLRQSVAILGNNMEQVKDVYIMTDLDRSGNQLTNIAREELERFSIVGDTMVRKELGRILKIKYFEDLKRAFGRLNEKGD